MVAGGVFGQVRAVAGLNNTRAGLSSENRCTQSHTNFKKMLSEPSAWRQAVCTSISSSGGHRFLKLIFSLFIVQSDYKGDFNIQEGSWWGQVG